MAVYEKMSDWVRDMHADPTKRPLPILTFPAVKLLGINTRQLLTDADNQAKGVKAITDRYNMPVALAYMDLSVEAEAFGANCVYSDHEIPTITGMLISTPEEAEALKVPEIGTGRTGTVHEGLKKMKELITDRPLLAECIGPFSLAGRLMDVNEAMINCYEEPEMVHCILEKVTGFIIENMKLFKKDGAQGVVMAEPLAGILSPDLAREFSSDYVKKIADEVQDDNFIIIYHNCGNGAVKQAEDIFSTGCVGYHFGNSIDIEDVLKVAPEDVFILGNIAPAEVIMGGTPEKVRKDVLALLEKCSKYKNFWLSSGCDVPPGTPIENVDAFFEAFEEFIKNDSDLEIPA